MEPTIKERGGYITASYLYDYIQCPHRVWRDLYGPQDERILETNPFVQLLWDRGSSYEKSIIERLGGFLDLSDGTREQRTKKLLKQCKEKYP